MWIRRSNVWNARFKIIHTFFLTLLCHSPNIIPTICVLDLESIWPKFSVTKYTQNWWSSVFKARSHNLINFQPVVIWSVTCHMSCLRQMLHSQIHVSSLFVYFQFNFLQKFIANSQSTAAGGNWGNCRKFCQIENQFLLRMLRDCTLHNVCTRHNEQHNITQCTIHTIRDCTMRDWTECIAHR